MRLHTVVNVPDKLSVYPCLQVIGESLFTSYRWIPVYKLSVDPCLQVIGVSMFNPL